MMQLLGEYECKIDAKGRMRLPSGLLGQLEEKEEAHEFVMLLTQTGSGIAIIVALTVLVKSLAELVKACHG